MTTELDLGRERPAVPAGTLEQGLRLVARAAVTAGFGLPGTLVVGDAAALLMIGPRALIWYLAVAAYGVVAWNGGLYRSRLTLLILDDVTALAGRVVAVSATAAAIEHARGLQLAPGWWARVWLAVVGLLVVRTVVYATARSVRTRGIVSHRTLIVGAGRVGQYMADAFNTHPEYGLQPVGFYDPDPIETVPTAGLPVVGAVETLEEAVHALSAKVVVLAFSSTPEEELVSAVRGCSQLDAEIFYVPRLFDLNSLSAGDIDDVWGLPLVRLRRASLRSFMWRIKRLLDLVVATVALLILSPLIAVLAVSVRVSIGRPVLFKQVRVGADNRKFVIYKFRTLPTTDPDIADTDWASLERRPNRLGAFLRATSLDELPQLWNIVRGDMSLVGPRPEREHFVQQFSGDLDFYDDRHRVPAGMTGLAQIHGLRGDTSIQDRARFDNAYVERWSLSNDLKILLRTPLAAIRWRGK